MSATPANPSPDYQSGGAMSVSQFCAWAGIGRTKFYGLVKGKQITPRKLGSKTIILRREAEEFLSQLPEAA